MKDTKVEQHQMARLKDLVRAKLDELNRTVELEQSHRHAQTIAIVQSDLGKSLMDQIQEVNGELLDSERVRLGRNSSAMQAGRLLTGRLFRVGIIGMAVLCTATAFLIWRSLAAQRMAIHASQLNEVKLAKKEHLLRTITDNLPVLISYVDDNEVVRFSNRTYKTWLDRDPVEALGRRLIDVMEEELYASRRDHIRNALSGNLTEFQAVLDLPDGRRYHQVSYVPDLASDGRVAGFFGLTMDITAMKRIEAQLEELARHDTLTGLPNRRHFEEELSEFLLRREEGSFALMFLDIDQFKAINDSFGHAVGDEALKHLSDCLKASMRTTDTIARLAGDEFVLLLPGLHEKADAEMIARKIIDNAVPGFTVDGKTVKISTSIGIAYAQDAAVTSEALFASADEALYNAKKAGRDTFKVMECNVNEIRGRPSRRVGDVNHRGIAAIPTEDFDAASASGKRSAAAT